MTLTAKDRCDAACSAQAYVRVMFRAGLIQLCAHHYRKHADAITATKPLDVLDERDRLTAEAAGAKGDEVR